MKLLRRERRGAHSAPLPPVPLRRWHTTSPARRRRPSLLQPPMSDIYNSAVDWWEDTCEDYGLDEAMDKTKLAFAATTGFAKKWSWIAGTSGFVLFVPLIYAVEMEQMAIESPMAQEAPMGPMPGM